MSDRYRFSGRTYLICGASSGLGQAVAELILRDGGAVWVASRRLALQHLRHEQIVRVQADLTTAAGVASIVGGIREKDVYLDGVLVNGGGPPTGGAFTLTAAQWHEALDALVVRPLELLRGLRSRLASGSSVLFVTSSSVREPIDELDASNVLRPSAAALANVLSRHLAPSVRVNSIAPGRISTRRLAEIDANHASAAGVRVEEHQQAVHSEIPLARYGTPEEFAEAAAFLLSPAASYITGAALQIDGGLLRGS